MENEWCTCHLNHFEACKKLKKQFNLPVHLFFVAVFYKLLCFKIAGKILFLEFWALKQHFYLLTLISTATQKISEAMSSSKKNPEFHILEIFRF